jgi:hypothetical protein
MSTVGRGCRKRLVASRWQPLHDQDPITGTMEEAASSSFVFESAYTAGPVAAAALNRDRVSIMEPFQFPFLQKQIRARDAAALSSFPASSLTIPREYPHCFLELAELLDRLASPGKHTEDVEADSLAERPALANGNLVTLNDTERGRDVGGEVLVPLLVTSVLGDEVEVFAADDDGTGHLGGDDGTSKDTATDRDETGEGALLVNVVALNGRLGRPEAQTNVLVPSPATLARTVRLGLSLGVEVDVRLLLESPLVLDREFCRHGC